MNVSKVGNQTSSQDPQAVNSRSPLYIYYWNENDQTLHVKCIISNIALQGFCWEPEHVPNCKN